jgi:DNA-binding response OmpR family regulator
MYSILVVEDEQDLQRLICQALKTVGYDTQSASNGNEALQLIGKRNFDLVISDILMPEMDGFQLIKEVRCKPGYGSTPFVFLTSCNQREQVREGMKLGADDYLGKPFEMQELFDIITTRLNRQKLIEDDFAKKLQIELKKHTNKLLLHHISGLPNEQALLQDIKKMSVAKKEFLTGFAHIHILGLHEVSYYLDNAKFVELTKKIITRLQECKCGTMRMYHTGESEFTICNISTDEAHPFETEPFTERVENFITSIRKPMNDESFMFTFSACIGLHYSRNKIEHSDLPDIYKRARIACEYVEDTSGEGYQFYTEELLRRYKNKIADKTDNYMHQKQEAPVERQQPSDTPEVWETKVFFLYPQSDLLKKLIKHLVYNEYSAYAIDDHEKLVKILKKYPNSIVYVNLDAVLPESQWETWIRGVMNSPETGSTRIGIISAYEYKDQELKEKYLFKMMIPCGFITLKASVEDSKAMMLKVMRSVIDKGKRKYIRVDCNEDPQVTTDIKVNGKSIRGSIANFSTAGMAVSVNQNEAAVFETVDLIKHIQLRLHGIVCHVDGKKTMVRQIGEANYMLIIMFINPPWDIVERFHEFILNKLQSEMSVEMQEL